LLKVTSFNANGIRAAAKKGFFEWFLKEDIDILCIQETKAQEHQLSDPIFQPSNYHRYFFDAEKKGYSGVAIYTKKEPIKISKGLGWNLADTEGRYIQIDFDNLSVASLYLPSGTSGDERQQHKYEFLDLYLPILEKQKRSRTRDYIICGDWNIAHNNIDIKNWKSNQKSSGFLPEERAWLDTLIDEVGMVDAFRSLYPEKVQYTWWSQRANAWNNNVGWRIDYHMVSPRLEDKISEANVYRDEKFSDHAPLTIEYDLCL
jgi:exodeoxyribonuclease-3